MSVQFVLWMVMLMFCIRYLYSHWRILPLGGGNDTGEQNGENMADSWYLFVHFTCFCVIGEAINDLLKS